MGMGACTLDGGGDANPALACSPALVHGWHPSRPAARRAWVPALGLSQPSGDSVTPGRRESPRVPGWPEAGPRPPLAEK